MSITGRRSSVLSSPLTLDDWLDRCPNDEPDSMIYDNDYASEVASMRVKQKMTEIEGFYKFIIDIYAKMGMPPQMLEGSLNYMDDHLSRCMLEAQEFEQGMFDKLCERKQDLLDQISKMLKDLCLPPYIPDDNVTLLQDAKKLKAKFTELNELKQKRLARLQLLRNKQIKLCSALGIEPPKVDMKTDIPSDEELNKLSNAILDLEREEQRRREKHHLMKDMINKCMEHLEYEPQDDFERELLKFEPCLTDNHLNKMSNLHSKLEAMYAKNDELHKKLQAKLIALYDRLDVEKSERDAFLDAHMMCKPSVLAEIEVEIERYEELKKQNIGRFIEKIKEELVGEYERCFVSQEEQDNFLSLANVSGECNEELLELCERELERIKMYYNEHKEILDKFQKWRQMWKELIELEVKANDPNRFNNRGGQLLLEEKKRKALQKGLPKIEKELAALNAKPEDQNQPSKIKVFGTDMDEFITGCWDELNTAKEEEKRERQRAKMTEGNGASRTKKIPPAQLAIKRTPSKRAAGAGITPTPNKLRCQRSVLCTPSNNTFRTNPQATSGSVKKSAKNLFQPSMIARNRQLTGEKSGIPQVSDSNSRADKKDKPTNNSNGSDFGSALSLSEQEFEEIIVSCPASARRRR